MSPGMIHSWEMHLEMILYRVLHIAINKKREEMSLENVPPPQS